MPTRYQVLTCVCVCCPMPIRAGLLTRKTLPFPFPFLPVPSLPILHQHPINTCTPRHQPHPQHRHLTTGQLFFACASGNITMARYLTRIEVDARADLPDALGNLAGHYFWNSVGPEGREEIAAVLASSRWPNSRPPRDRSTSRLRGRSRGNRNSNGGGGGGGGGWGRERRQYSRSVPPLGGSRGGGGGWGPDGDRSKRQSDGGEAGMKRLASDMMMLMKRR